MLIRGQLSSLISRIGRVPTTWNLIDLSQWKLLSHTRGGRAMSSCCQLYLTSPEYRQLRYSFVFGRCGLSTAYFTEMNEWWEWDERWCRWRTTTTASTTSWRCETVTRTVHDCLASIVVIGCRVTSSRPPTRCTLSSCQTPRFRRAASQQSSLKVCSQLHVLREKSCCRSVSFSRDKLWKESYHQEQAEANWNSYCICLPDWKANAICEDSDPHGLHKLTLDGSVTLKRT